MKKIVFSPVPLQRLDKETLHVCVKPLSPPEDNLSAEEQSRLAQYRFEKDAKLFASGRSALRQQLSHYLGTKAIQLKTTAYGKPYLENSSLQFNLSHSEPWLACAFCLQTPVGIDIETMRPFDEMDGVISNCFSVREQAYVNQGPPVGKIARFWRLWCRKEACLKALGCGWIETRSQLSMNIRVRSFCAADYALAVAIAEVS